VKHRKPAWQKLLAAVIAVIGLAAAWRYTPLAEFFTPQQIVLWSRAVRQTAWAPVALVLAFTPAAFLLFPRPLLTLFAVVAFGTWLGVTYSAAGILGAALATYYAGRLVRRETLVRLAGKELAEADKVLRRHGVLSIFAASMVPLPPFAVQGMIAGAVRIRLWDYTLGTVLGMLPGLLAASLFGDQIATALEDPARVSYWIAGGAVLALAVLVYIVRRWASKQQSP
jgi:phospholipase D1/2